MTTTLLLIDVQNNMLTGAEPVPNAPTVSKAIAETLARARAAGASIVHIRNNGSETDPDAPGTPGWDLVHDVQPGEHIVDKHECDAFVGTPLADVLPAYTDLVVVGMQSDYCVRETSLAALKRGHTVSLVRGAHATYDDGKPADEISRDVESELAKAGATITDDASFTT